jgi:hypothetical protein
MLRHGTVVDQVRGTGFCINPAFNLAQFYHPAGLCQSHQRRFLDIYSISRQVRLFSREGIPPPHDDILVVVT